MLIDRMEKSPRVFTRTIFLCTKMEFNLEIPDECSFIYPQWNLTEYTGHGHNLGRVIFVVCYKDKIAGDGVARLFKHEQFAIRYEVMYTAPSSDA